MRPVQITLCWKSRPSVFIFLYQMHHFVELTEIKIDIITFFIVAEHLVLWLNVDKVIFYTTNEFVDLSCCCYLKLHVKKTFVVLVSYSCFFF